MSGRSVEEVLNRVEEKIRASFPGVMMEFPTRVFPNHVELWVYVGDLNAYKEVKAKCEEIAEEEELDEMDPAIWILPKTWSGHWASGESEQEIRRQRREEFRRKHGMVHQP